MRDMLNKFKERFLPPQEGFQEEYEEEYVELNTDPVEEAQRAKILVRPFTLQDFDDVKPILNVLREGSTVALINIGILRDRDVIDLKRAINKLKKTADAIDGDIAGFGDDWIAVVPGFGKIHRQKSRPQQEQPHSRHY